MASHREFDRALRVIVPLIRKYPRRAIIIGLVVMVVLGVVYVVRHWPSEPAASGSAPPGTLLFCAWNVENFYDDRDDANIRDDSDDWFGNDPAAFGEKVDRLANGLLLMNGGAGPDIACLVEVENEQCMEALRDAVNAKLDAAGRGDKKYTQILFKQDNTGRHFAPGILTRLPVVADRTRKLGGRSNGRILEGHIQANGHDLAVIVAHWTSRVTDDAADGKRRMSYANDCYGRVKAILSENPDADVVVCGDFNDTFADDSLKNRACGPRTTRRREDLRATRPGCSPCSPAGRRRRGSIYGKGRWSVFDTSA